MAKFEYYNPHPYRIILTNERGERVVVQGYKRVVLDESFKVPPKTLKPISDDSPIFSAQTAKKIKTIQKSKKPAKPASARKVIVKETKKTASKPKRINTKREKTVRLSQGSRRAIVGRSVASSVAASNNFRHAISKNRVTISNNVAIGILSYNRLDCISRLLTSIRKYTDLDRVTVFVSDESSNQEVKKYLRQQDDIVLIDNDHRLGVAGNSNRLLKCLSRFKYCFLLNDDVEIKSQKWIDFYIDAHKRSKIHHFCFRQYGLIGAGPSEGKITSFNGVKVQVIDKKPHGAALFFTHDAFNRVGYFDEGWGSYGMEHVDWSNRVGLSGLQDMGFFDVLGSNEHLSIINAPCSTSKAKLGSLKVQYDKVKNDTNRVWVDHSDNIVLPSISYVIPIRDIGRSVSVETVVNNIRAQKFPVINITLVEEDSHKKVRSDHIKPINYKFVQAHGTHFNKSKAFNAGVLLAADARLVLHDADILVQDDYTSKVYDLLNIYDGIHIGRDVLYFSNDYTEKINTRGKVAADGQCINQVAYFEGGSIACTKKAYFKVGGFNESFIGYGIEDCDFFARLRDHCNQFYNIRTETFYHLFHGRTPGWQQCHETNKMLFKKFKIIHPGEYLKLLRQRLINSGFRNE